MMWVYAVVVWCVRCSGVVCMYAVVVMVWACAVVMWCVRCSGDGVGVCCSDVWCML